MKRPEPESPEAERRSQTAADWLVRRDRGPTAAEQDEFLDWLAADSRHGEWFALHRSIVGDFAALAQWRPEHSEEPNPDLLAAPPRRIRWFTPTLLAAAAAIALAAVWWRSPPAPTSVAVVASAELKRRILEDGSSVEPNHGAMVTMEFTATERRATLVRGEALFTVAKESSRPFIVRAGGVEVRAVGRPPNPRALSTLRRAKQRKHSSSPLAKAASKSPSSRRRCRMCARRLSADVSLRATQSLASWPVRDCAWSPQNRRARSS